MKKELDFAEVMEEYYDWAERVGIEKPDEPWLDLDGVWWPNPWWSGPEVKHPELTD